MDKFYPHLNDNDLDWRDQGVECPNCSCSVLEEIENYGVTNENTVKLYCADCQNEFDYKIS